jgi:hypothetical protein
MSAGAGPGRSESDLLLASDEFHSTNGGRWPVVELIVQYEAIYQTSHGFCQTAIINIMI